MTPKENFNAKNHPLKDVYKALGIDPPPAAATPAEKKEAEALLEKLRAARLADPDWKKAAKAFVDAEVKYGKDDPAEGKIVTAKHIRPKRSK